MRDAAAAHILSLEVDIRGYDVFNVSARSPFSEDETPQLLHDAPSIIRRHFPSVDEVISRKGWKLPQRIDRVYVIEKAEKHLGYRPKYNFDTYLHELNR